MRSCGGPVLDSTATLKERKCLNKKKRVGGLFGKERTGGNCSRCRPRKREGCANFGKNIKRKENEIKIFVSLFSLCTEYPQHESFPGWANKKEEKVPQDSHTNRAEAGFWLAPGGHHGGREHWEAGVGRDGVGSSVGSAWKSCGQGNQCSSRVCSWVLEGVCKIRREKWEGGVVGVGFQPTIREEEQET